jgi:hypothetical protein
MAYTVKVEFQVGAINEEVALGVVINQMNRLMDNLKERNQAGSMAVRVEDGDWIIRS